jgi:hypothetical protein
VEELPSAASSESPDTASPEASPNGAFTSTAHPPTGHGGPPYEEDMEPQSVVASANPAAPTAKRAARDSLPTATRAWASMCGTSLPQNGHVLSPRFT